MKKSTKIFLIVASAMVIIGTAIMGISHCFGGSLNRSLLSSVRHDAKGEFSNINISVSAADVVILPSSGDEIYAVCLQDDKISYELSVKDGTLRLQETDNRKWYDNIGVFFGGEKVELYLPKGDYESIKLNSASGSLVCNKSELGFKNADLSTASGKIDFASRLSGEIKLKTASGDIKVSGFEPNSLNISSSSGAVKLSNVTAKDGVKIKTASGSIELSSTDAALLDIESASGSIKGTLKSDKLFNVKTSSGNVDCPVSVKDGGECNIKTSSGDIKIKIAE